MRFLYVFSIIILLLSILAPACEKGEVVDPIPPREVKIMVSDAGEGDFSCFDLEPFNGETVPQRELICNKQTFDSAAFCDKYDVWLMASIDKLNNRLGTQMEETECNANFDSEMVVGVCARRPCSEPLKLCYVRYAQGANVFQFIQQYTCTDSDAEKTLHNHFMVVPQTGRNIDVEIYRYLFSEDE